ncbi:hypothetical protein C7T94_02960 [Pedobacter yulinensis]|uniref:Histidine phosphatase family protein n=1 Tax=Pedobacter yulinensis TaxID=2126353 RepID=A0A2T3HRN7_9SPHI|nr:histidine phosphatase family protein [Pedobacter yulinensis]PST85089.1 hypothetical protein C7T94_02960 [Pedobacter yulinensis]
MRTIYLFFCCLFLAAALHAQTVWVVRHAEKSTAVKTADPELSETGKLRAAALTAYFKDHKIDEVYSTAYIRTRETVSGVAEASHKPVLAYDSPATLAGRVWSGSSRKKVLIAGHSNTVPDILRALGASFDQKELHDEDYDYIFKIVRKGKKLRLTSSHYGALHRAGH